MAELFGDVIVTEPEDTDLGAAYWQQEHHRFEYSNHAQLMCDMNPLSFHQMGVAVPGTFVEPGQLTNQSKIYCKIIKN